MNINIDKMQQIIRTLDNYFASDEIVTLASVEYPEQVDYKSEDWLIYIFYSCLLDYGMRSKIYHQNLINTYQEHKEIFNPKYVLDNFSNNLSTLYDILKNNLKPRYPNIAVKKWLKLSERLSKYPSLLAKIKEYKTFAELKEFINNTESYGQKTGGLLLRLITDANICNFSDNIVTIPIDRHDIEISYLNGIINTQSLSSKQILSLANAYIKCGETLSLNPNKIDKYLWEIGSNFCSKKHCQNCPLKNTCLKGIKL